MENKLEYSPQPSRSFPSKKNNDMSPKADFMKYVEILTKHEKQRKILETDELIQGLSNLEIFNSALINQGLNPKVTVEKLIPFFNIEYFPADAAIFHYGQTIEKLYILCKGSVKEFVGKTPYEIQREIRNQSQKMTKLKLAENSSNFSDYDPSSNVSSPRKLGSRRTLRSVPSNKFQEDTSSIKTQESSKGKSRLTKAVKFINAIGSLKNKSTPKSSQKHVTRRGAFIQVSTDNYEQDLQDKNKRFFERFKEQSEDYFTGDILKVKLSRIISDGHCFGITIPEKPQAKTTAVISAEECVCISIKASDLYNILENEKKLSGHKVELFTRIFPQQSKAAIINFASYWEEENYKANNVIYNQGENADSIYALISGEVTFSKLIPMPAKERNRKTETTSHSPHRKLNPGGIDLKVSKVCNDSFFGEEDFFNNHPRSLTASVCSTRARVLRLDRKNYQDIFLKHEDMILQIKEKSFSKSVWNIGRVDDLKMKKDRSRDTAVKDYVDLKEQMYNLLKPEGLPSKPDLNSPKLKIFGSKKKGPSNYSNMRNLVDEITEKHPTLVEFVRELPVHRNPKTKLNTSEEGSLKVIPSLNGNSSSNIFVKDIESSKDEVSLNKKLTIVIPNKTKPSQTQNLKTSPDSYQFSTEYFESPRMFNLQQSRNSTDMSHFSLTARTLDFSANIANNMASTARDLPSGNRFKNRSLEVRKYIKRIGEAFPQEGVIQNEKLAVLAKKTTNKNTIEVPEDLPLFSPYKLPNMAKGTMKRPNHNEYLLGPSPLLTNVKSINLYNASPLSIGPMNIMKSKVKD